MEVHLHQQQFLLLHVPDRITTKTVLHAVCTQNMQKIQANFRRCAFEQGKGFGCDVSDIAVFCPDVGHHCYAR